MSNRVLVTFIALLAFAVTAAVPSSANASCSRDANGVQCVRFFVNKAGKDAYIGLTIHNNRRDESRSLSLQVGGGGNGHLDGSSDRKGRWWRDMGPQRFRDRRQYRYWRACALSVSDNWICTPWAWAGPGV
jgi:hypothetical protein